ncbi:hypothetical protein KQI42_02360 [Tissierella sp. MSJ-40]|uniref:Uncharacterized protein n=1 Tax=Tissierella simiarum TaxID=2841534 RepID=A0ABS6E1P6_9FIRM|nr:hypothetical protein [Tissierella simiarum]MBU5436832.1 hypothetical protein [Tissierella simiarum]
MHQKDEKIQNTIDNRPNGAIILDRTTMVHLDKNNLERDRFLNKKVSNIFKMITL